MVLLLSQSENTEAGGKTGGLTKFLNPKFQAKE